MAGSNPWSQTQSAATSMVGGHCASMYAEKSCIHAKFHPAPGGEPRNINLGTKTAAAPKMFSLWFFASHLDKDGKLQHASNGPREGPGIGDGNAVEEGVEETIPHVQHRVVVARSLPRVVVVVARRALGTVFHG